MRLSKLAEHLEREIPASLKQIRGYYFERQACVEGGKIAKQPAVRDICPSAEFSIEKSPLKPSEKSEGA